MREEWEGEKGKKKENEKGRRRGGPGREER